MIETIASELIYCANLAFRVSEFLKGVVVVVGGASVNLSRNVATAEGKVVGPL